MKRRIEQLLNGIFEYEQPKLDIRPDRIQVHARPDAVVQGSFVLSGPQERKVKGFLYTSSPRLICSTDSFQGIENEIHYQVDCSGMAEGTQEQGCITVSCELGEYQIPCEITVESTPRGETSMEVDSLEGFVDLARKDFQRAYRCFRLPAFSSLLKEKEPALLNLYEGMQMADSGFQSLESFLEGAGLKEAVEISVSQTSFVLKELSGPVQETLCLYRNTWGFQKIQVESDARFLRPEKKVLTTEDFAGRTCDLHLVIDTNLMHAGKNYGRLTLSTCYQTIQVEVEAHKSGAGERGRMLHICKIMMKELEGLYVKFRMKKIDLSTWVDHSVSVINSYRRAGGRDPYADLFLVQLYYADGKKQKAASLLDSLQGQKSRLNTPERYGYYLYMTTFFRHETAYVDRVEEEITRLFYRDKTNWKLLWILLYLQERFLKDDTARYEAVAEQYGYGCRSRILYVEAYQVLKKNPFLMRRLGDFELQLLRFAAREDILTAGLIRQAASLTLHHGGFDRRLYEILAAGYEIYPSADLVRAICLLLMQGKKRDARYFEWYARGVESGLRITGLYEYYMDTMDCQDMQAMPQVIRMYFAYDTSLDYRKRAAIYRRVIQRRDEDVQTYHNYRAAIERFALDQLEAVHISDDLAEIYRTFLRKSLLTGQTAEKLTRLLCMHEVTSSLPGLRRVIVHSGRLREECSAQFQKGRALIEIYDPDSEILLENVHGERFPAGGFANIRRFFDDEDMFVWCAEKNADFPGLVLYFCVRCQTEHVINKDTLPYFRRACEIQAFSDEFLAKLRREVMHYYLEHPRDESLPEFLERIRYLEYVKVDKAALITLLAEEGKCTDAFALLDAYGAEGIGLIQLVRICSRMVLELEFAENAMLVSLCYHCFASGKYDDKLLRYLLLYYEGPVQDMKQVWQAAVEFDLDTMLLEEKIIMLILFTRSGSAGSEPVFEAYLKKMGRKKLCRAYGNLKAYEYFVKGLPVADSVFQFLEREYCMSRQKEHGDAPEEVCTLALLQYYAQQVELTARQKELVQELLEDSAAKGLRFNFWKRFSPELLRPYQMEGRVFVEYAGNPQSQVNIFYTHRNFAGDRVPGGEEYIQEPMRNYFEGIFVREFTLFYGEELECYLEEETEEGIHQTDHWILRAGEEPMERMSKYQQMNRISKAMEQKDEKALREEVETYLTLEHLVQTVFTLV